MHNSETGKNNDILINVIDTGIGIDKSILPRIFDPFFTTKNRDYRKGTGLGLAMVFSVVKSHSGTIEIHTVTRDLKSISKNRKQKIPGVGTRISISMPIQQANKPTPKSTVNEVN